MITRFALLVGLVLLNAFFVAAEFSLVRARRTRLEAMAKAGDALAGIAYRATGNIASVLSASQLGVTLTGLGLGWVAESSMVEAFGEFVGQLPLAVSASLRVTFATVIALAFVTYITVVFGELAPKTLALNEPERWAKYFVPPLMVFAWVATPFTWLLNWSAVRVMRGLGQKPIDGEDALHSPEEIRMLVEQSQEGGAMERQDADLLDAVFEFSEKNAREVMTPRTEIVALDVTATLQEVLEMVNEHGFSRFPIYDETIDDIVGVMLAKDLIPVLAHPPETFSLRPLMRPPHFVPGSREVEDVLADFKRRKEHMVIVLDEYGGTAGLVTMEDLLEEIVGEILDEYDDPENAAEQTQTGEALLPGATNIGEMNEEYGTTVSDEEYSTIGGYVFGSLGRLPAVGDRVIAGGAEFTVHAMEGRRIDTLAMKLAPEGTDGVAVVPENGTTAPMSR